MDPDGALSLDQLLAHIDRRLTALRPLVREFEQLESARVALVADYGTGTERASRSASPAAAPSARGRRAPRGANRAAILRIAGEQPGITVAEIAQATGIGKPTVHSTVYALTRRGELQRAADGVKLAGSSEPAARAAPARRPAARRRPSRRAARSRATRRAAARRAPASSTPAPPAPAEAAPSMSAADGVPDVPPAQAAADAGAE